MDFADFEDNGYPVAEEEFDDPGLFQEEGAVAKFDETAIVATSATASALELADYELPPVSVINVTALAHLNTEVDLRLLTVSTRNIEYNPQKANSACVRLMQPRATCTVFGSGRITVCGAKNKDDAKHALKLTAKIVKRAGHDAVRFTGFKVTQVVCTASCGFPVRLENLAKDHAKYCNYEPEIFCGLVYRHNPTDGVKASVLVFVSGRLVISGCKNADEAYEVYKNLYAILYQYRS